MIHLLVPYSPAPVMPIEFGVTYSATRETFDAMNNDQLMHQVKQHLDLKKNPDFWNAQQPFQDALKICCEILKGRNIEVTIKDN